MHSKISSQTSQIIKTNSSSTEGVEKKSPTVSAKHAQLGAVQKKLIGLHRLAAIFVTSKINHLQQNQQAQCLGNIRSPVNTVWLKNNPDATKNSRPNERIDIGSHRKETIEYAKLETFKSGDEIPEPDVNPTLSSLRGKRLFGLGTEAHRSVWSNTDNQGKLKGVHPSLLPPKIKVTSGFEHEPQAHKIEISEMPASQKPSVLNPGQTNAVNLTATELGAARLSPKKIS